MKKNTLNLSIYIILFLLAMIVFKEDFIKEPFYKDIQTIKNPSDPLVIVNKNNILPNDYIPLQLEMIDPEFATENKFLVHDAKIAFENLSRDAKVLGYQIIAVSAYRDYHYQEKLYHDYVNDKGQQYADNCSARPGHSEHQTGLAIDVMGSNQDYNLFEESIEFSWMKENAHKYGFIMRYPKGKEKRTGFKYEPWHYRYVGIEKATHIYEKNLTLEEYINQYE